jgi:hypothetical protein
MVVEGEKVLGVPVFIPSKTSVLADDSTGKLLPTRFEKIHMINDVHFDSAIFAEKVRELQSAARRGSRRNLT